MDGAHLTSIQHSTFNIEHSTLKKGALLALPSDETKRSKQPYERSPFSCNSWQSMQKGVQGTAARRLSPIVAPQFVQVP